MKKWLFGLAFGFGCLVAVAMPTNAAAGLGDCHEGQRCGAISGGCDDYSGRSCEHNLLGDCQTVTSCDPQQT